jgi:hypothetical protein
MNKESLRESLQRISEHSRCRRTALDSMLLFANIFSVSAEAVTSVFPYRMEVYRGLRM